MDDAEDGVTDRLNDLADFCDDYNYGLICLTGSDSMSVERWKDRTGATYPILLQMQVCCVNLSGQIQVWCLCSLEKL